VTPRGVAAVGSITADPAKLEVRVPSERSECRFRLASYCSALRTGSPWNLERSRRCPRPAASYRRAVVDQRGLSAPLACRHAGSVPAAWSSSYGDLGQQAHGFEEPKALRHRSPAFPGGLDDESSTPDRSSATAEPDTTDRPVGFGLDDVTIIGPAEATQKALGMRWNPPHARRLVPGSPRLPHAPTRGHCLPRQSRLGPQLLAALDVVISRRRRIFSPSAGALPRGASVSPPTRGSRRALTAVTKEVSTAGHLDAGRMPLVMTTRIGSSPAPLPTLEPSRLPWLTATARARDELDAARPA
jgi:hypothetical protein